jgi:hypothetical protein
MSGAKAHLFIIIFLRGINTEPGMPPALYHRHGFPVDPTFVDKKLKYFLLPYLNRPESAHIGYMNETCAELAEVYPDSVKTPSGATEWICG